MAIFDTGSTHMTLPQKQFDIIYQQYLLQYCIK
jgi:hypothetical protein